ncbi:carbohydrate esterase family 9 protein [Neurospora crassa]|uniref:N-acetylglucosamine-6-phosphate deacetylase n=1 Tax=Neurospora crassa (strain ATCC 24698 / 74-OR23-1A / CBS 708.71 / DSM 1257 / FGSC 987) TaxID=367110 RepID=Q7S6H9_NEUCR|nr:N-acetylglucosamine-6-phosphate deacetylase [Neurospora crassa OR74A]EAA31124.1 N-acetylglucosamine-6-phosphate deacetylase [Neurospora crassa OR74A]KHE83302.1 carbohydrate esterase family 9 protein [Neurospora crassa]|eukprot:XP_960360.1 N-acetylglucosamine-6-phosphate deacetylase [Neurospora crassa OR74A]
MPAATPPSPPLTGTGTGTGITKLTNCRLIIGDSLIPSDLFIDSLTGKILEPSDNTLLPNVTLDLQNRIVSPGLIDCQLNGAFGFNFSTLTSSTEYLKNIHSLNKKLIRTGVTSYLPTLTSQKPELYHSALPHLGPLPGISSSSNRHHHRNPPNGSESLGAHVEGPFLSPLQHGIHDPSVLRAAHSFEDLEHVYGSSNLSSSSSSGSSGGVEANIKLITIAPERGSIVTLIPELVSRGIVVSIGHTETSLAVASAAVKAGATMITHLFNAMRPLHHREPGVFGLLGLAAPTSREEEDKTCKRPYYGVIADGIHLHPLSVCLAYNLHPKGFILVTDAMHLAGMPDGKYEWMNGEKKEWIEKRGSKLCIAEPPLPSSSSSLPPSPPSSPPQSLLVGKQNGIHVNGHVNGGPGRSQGEEVTTQNGNGVEKKKKCGGGGGIAGSSATLLECVNNVLQWTGMPVPKALASVTSTPAEMLGLKGVKGSLKPGADADLVVFEEVEVEVEDLLDGSGKISRKQLVVEEVWKFGERVFVRDGTALVSSKS